MEAYELLNKLDSVKAPAGFEQTVMAQLSARKRKKVRVRTVRYSFAGAFAGVVAILLVVNFLILPGRGPGQHSELERSLAPELRFEKQYTAGQSIPIIEAVDYSSEIRTLSDEVPTVYILEQVSWTTDTKIKY
ncbi:MAG: hypothetical protein PVF22_05820 [Candidatus Aminicenantes bacterium]|jgi:hypothetical protein